MIHCSKHRQLSNQMAYSPLEALHPFFHLSFLMFMTNDIPHDLSLIKVNIESHELLVFVHLTVRHHDPSEDYQVSLRNEPS